MFPGVIFSLLGPTRVRILRYRKVDFSLFSCHIDILMKCDASPVKPAARAIGNAEIRCQAGEGTQAAAAVEHVVVAVDRKCRGRKYGSGGQARATDKHTVVAVGRQRRGRQCGGGATRLVQPRNIS